MYEDKDNFHMDVMALWQCCSPRQLCEKGLEHAFRLLARLAVKLKK